MNHQTEVSLVIPLYNEEKRVGRGVQNILNFLDQEEFSWELILVDDGSTDRTIAITQQLMRGRKNTRVLPGRHLGKGGAIKRGVLASRGEWVIFLDIDLATPIQELTKFMRIRKNFDVIIGSRKMKGAQVEIHQSTFREFGGRVFTWLTNRIVTSGISDITCGFKLFRGTMARQLFSKLKLSGWSFDAEVLYLAQKAGARIKEVPVRWRDDPQTRVKLLRDTLESFFGLLKIRWYDLLGRYNRGSTSN